MNKLMTVLGVAAVATLAGCKDPTYQRIPLHGDEVRNAAPVEAESETTKAPEASKESKIVIEKGCTCPANTKHKEPCKCGAADCKCVVVTESQTPPAPVAGKPAEKTAEKHAAKPGEKPAAPASEYTEYVVQHGDYLAKISKKTNVSIAAIKKANNLTSDKVRVGQKLKIPGKFDATVLPPPAPAAKPAAAAKKATPYTGATKEYVVKNGDSLGAIAYGSGINIRQLKAMNGLEKDTLRVGQKLKIPAEKVQAAPTTTVKKPAPKAEVKKPEAKAAAPAKAEPAKVEAPVTEEAVPQPAPEAGATKTIGDAEVGEKAPEGDDVTASAPAPAAVATESYVVKEGDDMTSVSITYGVSASAIRELNNLPDEAQLKPGQVIKLPVEAQP